MNAAKATLMYALATLAVGAYLLLFEIGQHGRTLDDKVQRDRGAATLRYIATLDRANLPSVTNLEDFSRGDPLYGPLGATVAVWLGRRIAPWIGNPEDDRHLEFSAGLSCWFLVWLFSVLQLGRHVLGTTLGGASAGAALLAMPRIAGMATCNPSDLPAAACATFAVWMLVRWLAAPKIQALVLVCLGFASAAAVRPQNGGLLLLVGIVFVCAARRRKSLPRIPAWHFVFATVVTYGFWIALWPDFWTRPFSGPLEVVSGFLREGHRYTQGTLWFGQPAHGPWLYPLVWLGITTPLWILAPAILGAVTCRRNALAVGLLAWFVVSAGKHLSGLGNFGGVRHFLDAFVPVAMWSAQGWQWLGQQIAPRRAMHFALYGLLACALLTRLQHPYESCYFNPLVGGTAGAAGKFDMEPNGATMLVLMRRLRERLDAKSTILIPGPADVVDQLALPNGVRVHEIATIETARQLTSSIGKAALAGRTVYFVTLQDRTWGRFDPVRTPGLSHEVLRIGPHGLAVGFALEVTSPEFYTRLRSCYR